MKWVHFIKFFSSISGKENTYCMSHLYKTSFNSEHTDTHLHKCLLSETHPHTLIHREQLNNSCRAKSDYLVPQFPLSLVFSFYFFQVIPQKGSAAIILCKKERDKYKHQQLVLNIKTQYDWTLLRMWEHIKHSVSI